MQSRKSRQRDEILEVLKKTDRHPTADWIYMTLKKKMPGLSLGTVYRNLNVLAEQGLIRKLPFGSSEDRFEARIAPHYHLVCEGCGLVKDFHMSLYSTINKKAEQMSTFKISRHRIDFFGLCEKCRKMAKHQDGRKQT